MKCIVEFCDREVYAKRTGECNAHWQQRRRSNFTGYTPIGSYHGYKGICEVPNCGRQVKNTRICTSCYKKTHRYGITADELIALDRTHCQVCRAPGSPHMDHDHATGKFRGVLCFNCNAALGLVNDNIDTLKGLVAYLETHV